MTNSLISNELEYIEEKNLLKNILPYISFPLIIGGGIISTYFLISLGFRDIHAFSIMVPIIYIVIMFFERINPYRKDWNKSDNQEFNDIFHTLTGTFFGASLGKAFTDIFFTWLSIQIAKSYGGNLWPIDLPFFIQIILVFLVADFGRYWQHRMMHISPFLWRFHALHHSVERICTLKTSRSHIIERIFQPIFLFWLLILLAAPPEVVFFYMMSNSFLGMIDHSNVNVKLGPLTYFINGPMEHRIHHSFDLKEGNSNFGSAIVIWDMIFGTYMNPRKHKNSPEKVGIPNDNMPDNFLKQLLLPFFGIKT